MLAYILIYAGRSFCKSRQDFDDTTKLFYVSHALAGQLQPEAVVTGRLEI
jgi:hypothetical protein